MPERKRVEKPYTKPATKSKVMEAYINLQNIVLLLVLLLIVYAVIRVAAIAWFHSKRDYIRRLLHGTDQTQSTDRKQ